MAEDNKDKIVVSKDMVYVTAILVLVVVLAASVFTGGFGLFGKTNGTTNTGGNNGGGTVVTPDSLGKTELPDLSGLTVLGQSSAPVLVVEFSDFQCPFCGIAWGREYGGAQFTDSRGVVKKIKSEYVDTGKARFVYFPVSFLGQESVDAAEAAFCAQDQGKFYEYHDELFKNQDGENQGTFKRENLVKFAETVGLDKAKFESCIDGTANEEKLASLMSYYRSVVGTGTPTYFIAIKKDKVDFAKLKQITDAANLGDPPQVPNLVLDKTGEYYVAPAVGAQGYTKIKQILDTVNY